MSFFLEELNKRLYKMIFDPLKVDRPTQLPDKFLGKVELLPVKI